MSALKTLLKDLGSDASLEREYEQDAEAVMERYGLDAEDRETLRRRDLETLEQRSGLRITTEDGNKPVKGYE